MRDILRAEEMAKVTKQTIADLAKAQMDFNDMLARQREIWAREEEEHITVVKQRKIELDVLEAQRLNTFVPFDILKLSTEEQLTKAEDYFMGLRQREEDNEALTEHLQDKLDEVGMREQDVNRREQELVVRQQGIDQQTINSNANAKWVSEQLADLKLKQEQALAVLNQRETAIILQQEALSAERVKNDALAAELAAKAVRLTDERGVLDRAWQELERKRKALSP